MPTTTKTPKPYLIFVYGVIYYKEMEKIINILGKEQYYAKYLANNVVEINCLTLDSYQKLAREFNNKNIHHHTYQIKEE